MSPSVPVHTSDSTRPEKIRDSVLAMSHCIVVAMLRYSARACTYFAAILAAFSTASSMLPTM
jgi:hypothetical protein